MSYRIGDVLVCEMKNLSGFTYGENYSIVLKVNRHFGILTDTGTVKLFYNVSIKRGFISLRVLRELSIRKIL